MYTPRALIEQKVAAGEISQVLVERARQLWRKRLQGGVTMPNGERALISDQDLHHLLLDGRILRKPERIERLLTGIVVMRTAHSGRRIGLSEWAEEDKTLHGYVIVEDNGHIRTMHLTNIRTLQKQMQQGDLLWVRNQSSQVWLGEGRSEIS